MSLPGQRQPAHPDEAADRSEAHQPRFNHGRLPETVVPDADDKNFFNGLAAVCMRQKGADGDNQRSVAQWPDIHKGLEINNEKSEGGVRPRQKILLFKKRECKQYRFSLSKDEVELVRS